LSRDDSGAVVGIDLAGRLFSRVPAASLETTAQGDRGRALGDAGGHVVAGMRGPYRRLVDEEIELGREPLLAS
jgi:hypothetical protein